MRERERDWVELEKEYREMIKGGRVWWRARGCKGRASRGGVRECGGNAGTSRETAGE